jgi:hypothetical protein
VVEEIIGRRPELTGTQLGRLENEIRRERQRRASSASGGQDAAHVQKDAAPRVTEVLEYRPYEDGYLHRHCCGSDRGDRLFRGTYSRSQKGVRQGVRATLRLCM